MILIICLIVILMQMELGATSTLCLEIGHGNRQYVMFDREDLWSHIFLGYDCIAKS